MWNLNDDNELDNLSREAAEDFSLDQSPDSWNKVHARLDAEMPEEKRRRYLLFFLFFLVVGSGVFWFSRMNGSNSDQSSLENSPIAKNSLTEKSSSQQNPTSSFEQNKTAQSKNLNAPSGVRTSNGQEPVATSSTLNGTLIADDQNVSTNHSSANTNVLTSSNKGKKPLNRRTSSGDEIVLGVAAGKAGKLNKNKKQEVINASTEESVANSQATEGSNENATSPKNDQPPTQVNDKTVQKVKDEVSEAPKKSEPKEKEIPSKDNSRWTFGAVYAPDISTVNFTHTQPIGLNIGVTVDYKLSPKFSLQTGFIYTKKNYKLNGEDYHPPKGGWFDYVNLKDVTGNCSMYDIPLNLRYNVVRKKSSNIFFTAGLSSYLMNNEQYSYYYYYNGVPATRDRAYATSDDYLFSIINFSAGFEKNLNKSFSLQVEPFFKQTLTGVGFGEISLNSTGIYFSLRYSPLKPSKTVAEKKN